MVSAPWPGFLWRLDLDARRSLCCCCCCRCRWNEWNEWNERPDWRYSRPRTALLHRVLLPVLVLANYRGLSPNSRALVDLVPTSSDRGKWSKSACRRPRRSRFFALLRRTAADRGGSRRSRDEQRRRVRVDGRVHLGRRRLVPRRWTSCARRSTRRPSTPSISIQQARTRSRTTSRS